MAAVIRAFEKYPVINRAYADVRGEIETALDIWNSENPEIRFGALDLWLMGYFHYCIPFAAQPEDLGADHKDVRQRMREILYPIFEDQSNKLTPTSYVAILRNKGNIQLYLKRLFASRSNDLKVTSYIIPGTATSFSHLNHAGYLRRGDKIILRARKVDHEAVVNSNGGVEINIKGVVKSFPSVSEAGSKGLKYPGFSQWDAAYLIGDSGKRIPLRELKDRFEKERPFPAHFDSPTQPKQNCAPPLLSMEETDKDGEFYEGSIRRISVEVRERDAAARKACIAHYEARCFICKFDFGQFYGPEAEGFIHVHHREMLSKTTVKRKVDPINDLVPLCPNCHSVVHLRKDSYEVEEVNAMVEKQQKKIKLNRKK